MCLERISNFLCVNCLKESVTAWLLSAEPDLIPEFNELHQKLVKMFTTEEGNTFCVKCKQSNPTVLCVYCYAKEVFWWLFEKDFRLAKMFSRMLNLDFLNLGYFPFNKPRNHEMIEIVSEREKVDINICEACEQESTHIKLVNGQWICERCREEES